MNGDARMECLSVGGSVDIQRSDGRVHCAKISSVNEGAGSVTVEWFESGETKGKDVDLNAVFSLNPDLFTNSRNMAPPDFNQAPRKAKYENMDDESSLSDEISDFSAKKKARPHATRASTRFLKSAGQTKSKLSTAVPRVTKGFSTANNNSVLRSQSTSRINQMNAEFLPTVATKSKIQSFNTPAVGKPRGDVLRGATNAQNGLTSAHSSENINNTMNRRTVTGPNISQQETVNGNVRKTVGPAPAPSLPQNNGTNQAQGRGGRKSYAAREVDKIQKNRDERRAKIAVKKGEKQALMSVAPGNPSWEFANMIREFRAQLDFCTLRDGDVLEEHQITVAVRKRPINKKEIAKKEIDVITIPKKDLLYVHEPKTKVDLTKYLENQPFKFDYAFDDTCDNELVYKYTARPLVHTIFEGGMATCFAYGQTGSGKTHTMGGDFQGKNQDCSKGIYAFVAKDVFSLLTQPRYKSLNLRASASFFEIYGGKVFDLLNQKKKLRVLEDGKQVVQVVGLQEVHCNSVEDVLKVIKTGTAVRTSGQTAANNQSSRSHAVFQIILRKKPAGRYHQDENIFGPLYGKFSLIDLAGNERGADTNSASRHTRMEGAEINKSLLALKECIRALGRKGGHLPFRGSKLTQVLRDSFIGDKSKTCMIAMISPGLTCCEHTLNTLRYADRVKELGAATDNGSAPNYANELSMDDSHMTGEDSRLSALAEENNMSVDQAACQEILSALKEAEDDVVEQHGQYFGHRDEIEKVLIPLYEMTNEVDCDLDAYAQHMQEIVEIGYKWWSVMKVKVERLRQQLDEEEKVHRQHTN